MHLTQKGQILGRGYVLAADRFVVAVGACTMDITGSSAHPLVAQDSTPGRIRCAPGGVARNVAENLARLGHDVRLVSAVGEDLFGSSVLEHTRRAGVDVQGCQVLAGQATSTYLSLHGFDGDMAMALNDMAILEHITPERLTAQLDRLRHASAVLVDCNLPQAALGWIFAQVRTTPLFAEPVSAFKCRRLLPWLEHVHTLKANRLEAQALTERIVATDDDVVAAARWMHDRGVRQVVLSLGGRGLYWSNRAAGCGWQPAISTEVVNATGAGDALMAGLMHRFLEGASLQDAVGFAAGCAAVTMTAPQANHPNLSIAAVLRLLDAADPVGQIDQDRERTT